MNKIERLRPRAGYEQDFALWSAEQAALIRAGRFDAMDRENIAEEIESLARSDRREIESRLKVLLAHLLKWQAQPEQRKEGWKLTIVEQRRRIGKLIQESPSLKSYPGSVLAEEYEFARNDAASETGLDLEMFPVACPFTAEQALDRAFWPEG